VTLPLPSNLSSIQASHPYFGPLMAEALECLCIKASIAPNPPRHCSFRIGSEIVHDLGEDTDLCCEGLAYVTMLQVFPSSEDFPTEDIAYQARSKCGPVSWGVELRMGLVRCAPVGENGYIVQDRAWEAAALQGIYDTQTLISAACCLRNWVVREDAPMEGMSAIMGSVTEGTPNGGCIERNIDLNIQIPGCGC
jgi:hypothetical protein